MTDTPEDWVLIEAAKRSSLVEPLSLEHLCNCYKGTRMFRALCDMIAKHEQKPVDRKLLCALEAARLENLRWTALDVHVAARAIELWEEGFGK